MSKLVYPATATTNQVDDYHGTLYWRIRIAGWSDDNSDATKLRGAGGEQGHVLVISTKFPNGPRSEKRITQLWNYERFGVPMKQGGRYFITRNNGLQNQSVLYSLNGRRRRRSQPCCWTRTRCRSMGRCRWQVMQISDDGNLMAYGLARAGSDWEEWRCVRDVRTGRDTADEIHWVKFSGASWTKDNLGFYYSRYAEAGTGAGASGRQLFPQTLLSPARHAAKVDDKR